MRSQRGAVPPCDGAGRWFHANPRLGSGDLSHLTAKGHLVVGEYVYGALLYAWAQWRREWRREWRGE